MPKYRNGIGNARFGSFIHGIRKHTNVRSRKVLLANMVCLLLFLIGIGLATRKPPPLVEVEIPAVSGIYSGSVYYISKRTLCSRSIAYDQLGIQPIAVSKVILRPIVHEGKIEEYDDRLEVLENAMINDVVFLDRNVSDSEAELNANVCPLHTVSVLPNRTPTRYTSSTLLFGVVIKADDVPNALQHWRYWARHTDVAFHILLPGPDYYRTAEVEEMIRGTLEVEVKVESNREADDLGKLSLMLVEKMQSAPPPDRVWFIILTPTTFVTSVKEILLALEPYDATRSLYMGGLSESTKQKEQYGVFAYGGAGIVLTRPVIDLVVTNMDKCAQIDETIYGDGLLGMCINRHTSVKFTVLPSFHQCDVEENIHGILQSALEFTTIHNLAPEQFSLFPKWHQLGPETSSPSTYTQQVDLFHRSRRILSPQNWGIRYRFGKTGRFLLTNGYSITEFLRPPYPSNYDIRNAVEGTFSNDNDVNEFTFHAAREGGGTKELPMRYGLREGDDKRTYYLRAIEIRETQANPARAARMNRHKREAAVFIYVNEWGTVRRGIEVVWLL